MLCWLLHRKRGSTARSPGVPTAWVSRLPGSPTAPSRPLGWPRPFLGPSPHFLPGWQPKLSGGEGSRSAGVPASTSHWHKGTATPNLLGVSDTVPAQPFWGPMRGLPVQAAPLPSVPRPRGSGGRVTMSFPSTVPSCLRLGAPCPAHENPTLPPSRLLGVQLQEPVWELGVGTGACLCLQPLGGSGDSRGCSSLITGAVSPPGL